VVSDLETIMSGGTRILSVDPGVVKANTGIRITARAGDLAHALALAAMLLDDARVRKIKSLGMATLRAGDSEVAVSTNVLELAFTGRAVAAVETGGEIAVDGARLPALVAGFRKDDVVEFSASESTLAISVGRGRWRLPLCPIEELPAPLAIEKEIAELTLDAATLLTLLAPAFCAGQEPSRYYLNGLLIHSIDTGLASAATNGTWLMRRTVAADPLHGPRDLIIPNRTIAILGKIIKQTKPEQITLRRGKALVCFETKQLKLTSKLIDATFPDYERVIPAPSDNFAELDRRELITAIERLIAVESASEHAYPVCVLQWGDGEGLSLTLAREPDNGREIITAQTGGQARAAMASARLADLLDELDCERVRLELNGPGSVLKIGIVGDPGLLALLMPTAWNFESANEARHVD
jgi:DNA polymerase III subunit beta